MNVALVYSNIEEDEEKMSGCRFSIKALLILSYFLLLFYFSMNILLCVGRCITNLLDFHSSYHFDTFHICPQMLLH